MEQTETPLMKQYNSIKIGYPDYILFFRLGDFYEMFDKDAIIASRILNIALTKRNKNKEGAVPLCGIPYHSAQTYIKRLLHCGHKVAICEQTEDPKNAKGIVKREVIRLITPGTIVESELLNEKESSFLSAFFIKGTSFGISFLDFTTGELRAAEYSGHDFLFRLQNELHRIEPKEVVFPYRYTTDQNIMKILNSLAIQLSPFEKDMFSEKEAIEILKNFYRITQIEGIGLHNKSSASIASSILINYLEKTQKKSLFHIKTPFVYGLDDYMVLDYSTIVNLELLHSLDFKTTEGTLLHILDRTSTPMGLRCLKDWLLHPLIKCDEIQKRLDAIEEFLNKRNLKERIKINLKDLYDLERICGRISLKMITPQSLITLKYCIPLIQKIRDEGVHFETPLLKESFNKCHPLKEVFELIDTTLEDTQIGEQRSPLIRRNVSQDLDHFYDISYNGKKWLSNLEKKERERTKISSLKVGFNKVFGYYIEITKSNLSLVPENYIRKQTLVNGERFITEELKQFENEILGAEEKIQRLEKEIFDRLLEKLIAYIYLIQETSKALAYIDCLISLTDIASQKNYSKPFVDMSLDLEITQGRHPVLEVIDKEHPFVPNDLIMNYKEDQLIILTGPNMAGKSTYMRQIALIVLMTQIGSFVPAQKARIGVIDKIFTRVGASDRLYKGQSTFMVEMIETASILHQATQRSLIILDEIGRGTSTYDGISIAWAVAEYLHNSALLGSRTLFATHYHELTELPNYLNKARNYTIAIHEEKGAVVFLYTVVRGASDRSYGVHVAQLAGLPRAVIDRAYHILENIEDKKNIEIAQSETMPKGTAAHKPIQLSLFSNPETKIIKEIREFDSAQLSPLKALKKINEWKKMFANERSFSLK